MENNVFPLFFSEYSVSVGIIMPWRRIGRKICMRENVILILSMFFGGMMNSITINSLGEHGNNTMHLIGKVLLVYSIVILLKRIYQNNKRST